MKKRILSLLLAVITILQMFPVFALPTIAEDDIEELSVDDMEVGKLYRAEFISDVFVPNGRYPFIDSGILDRSQLPRELTVTRKSADDYDLVYVTEDTANWPSEYTEYRYVTANKLSIAGGISVDSMEIGQIYTASWNTTDTGVYLYKKIPASESDIFVEYGYNSDQYVDPVVSTDGCPTELIVCLEKENDPYVRVTNEDWPEKYAQYRYLDPEYDIVILGEYVAPPADDGLVYGQVGLVMDGESVETLAIAKGEKTYVFTELGNAIEGTPTYRWQMLLDRESNSWANIQDYVYPYAPISEALLANAGLEDGTATLRCIATRDGINYASGELDITVDPTLPDPEPPLIPEPETEADPESRNTAVTAGSKTGNDGNTRAVEAFHIVINYTFRHMTAVTAIDGTTAAGTHTVTRPAGGSYTGTVPSPPVVGYLPYVLAEHVSYIEGKKPAPITYGDKEYYLATNIAFNAIDSDATVNVYYIPQTVNFLVKIYEQNLHNDEYVLAGTVVKSGLADAKVGERLDTARTGFSALYYDPNAPISDDGTGEVEIYYDRNYYLVKFELDSDEAYGATPYYVRYGSQVMLPTPTRPGYDFTGWTLTSVTNDQKQAVADHTYPASPNGGALITIQHNLEYEAGWYASTTSYTIAYWWQNADPKVDASGNKTYDYTVWKTVAKQDKAPGAYVTEADIATFERNAPFEYAYSTVSEKLYFTYNDDKTTRDFAANQNYINDKGVQVKGDGSTIINIYYDRNDYELRFYYAMTAGSGTNATHYVVGGSTYRFGSAATISANDNEIKLIDHYMGDYTSERGQINELPTYENDGNKYTYGTESSTVYSTSYTYHYITFTAKYGANISNLWPVDIFSSVTRTVANDAGKKWTSKEAFVSAWNGEHHVYYSQHNSNQTIKGAYQILDYTLLWDYEKNFGISNGIATEESKTVSYMCYWLNGAKTNWSIPSLFEYYIHLPSLDGQSEVLLKYDTFDNFDPKGNKNDFYNNHIHPSIEGFTKNGSITWEVLTNTNSNYQGAYRIHFNYTRNNHTLTFDDQYTKPPETETVAYGTDLNQYASHVPDYPSSLEANACVFAGWFTNEECTNRFDFNTTMPDKEVYLYAKWEDCSYTATIYLDSKKQTRLGDPQTVLFGSPIKEPNYKDAQANNPAYANLIFAGWYYMDGTEEKRFDFKTMVLKQNLEIYAKWTSKVPVPYTVYYAIKNSDGSYTQIADPTKGISLAGISKSFTAKVGTDLDEYYRTGYFPANRSHSMHMSNTEANEYTFVYSASSEVRYSVVHQFVNDEFVSIIGVNTITLTIATTITSTTNQAAFVSLSFRDGVTRDAIVSATGKSLTESQKDTLWDMVKKLSPDCYQQDLILTTNSGENVAYFNWADRKAVSIYQVIHKFQSLDDPKTYVAELPMEFAGNIGDTATATAVERYGFTRKAESVSGKITKVEYKNGAWAGGLVLELYYDRDEYNYTVHHYKIGTTTSVADSTTSNAPFETIVKISDVKKDVSGYTLANGDTTVEISKEGQEIICYYQGLEVLYYYKVSGSTLGGYLDPDNVITNVDSAPKSSTLHLLPGYTLKEWYYTVGDSTEKISVPDTWLSGDRMTVSPAKAPAEWAGKAINIYAEVQPTSLTISGFFSGEFNPHPYLQNQGFIYHINGKKDTDTAGYSITVALPIGESKSILGLPAGEYTITVESTWSWRYSGTNIGYTVTENDDSGSWDAGAQKLTFKFDGSATVEFKFTPPAKDSDKPDGEYFITDEVHN